jgi:hypothetical protein
MTHSENLCGNLQTIKCIEQQQQKLIQAERLAIEMTNELRLKELAKKK